MPRIPTYDRSENVAGRPQPFSTGDGYAAPGRAMQQLGEGLQKLGSGLDAALKVEQGKKDEEDDYKMRMDLHSFVSQQDKFGLDYDGRYDGNGDDYTDGRMAPWDSAATSIREKYKDASPKIKRMLELRLAQLRQGTYGRTIRREEGKAQKYWFNYVDAGHMKTIMADLDGTQERLDWALKTTEDMIEGAPRLSPEQKTQLKGAFAGRILGRWRELAMDQFSKDGKTDPKAMVDDLIKKYSKGYVPQGTPPQPQKPGAPAGPGPQSSLIPPRVDPDTRKTVGDVAQRIGVHPDAIALVVATESGWNARTRSPGRGTYVGMTQIGRQTFVEAGGRLGGLTFDEFVKAPPAAQLRAYADYLGHYGFADKLKRNGIDMSKLTPAQQAVVLQGFQFAPNAEGWMRALAQGRDAVVTPTKQASGLRPETGGQSPTISSMTRYFERRAGKAGPSAPAPVAGQPASGTPYQPTMYVGDSVAHGLAQRDKVATDDGGTVVDRDPTKTLQWIDDRLAKDPQAFSGKRVVLSSGLLNNPAQADQVLLQIDRLKKAGATVVLAGAPDQKTSRSDLKGVDPALKAIAEKAGVEYLGPYAAAKDGVHPGDYKGYGKAPERKLSFRPSFLPDGADYKPISSTKLDGGSPRSRAFGGPRPTGVHAGLDGEVKAGTPILAHMAGTVVDVRRGGGLYGLILDVKYEDGTTHRHAHLGRVADGIKVDMRVEPGQELAYAGASGTKSGWVHFHNEIFKDDAGYRQFGRNGRTTQGRLDPIQYWGDLEKRHTAAMGATPPAARMGLGGPPEQLPPSGEKPVGDPADLPIGEIEGRDGAPVQVAEAPPPWVSGAPRSTTDHFMRHLYQASPAIRKQAEVIGKKIEESRRVQALFKGFMADPASPDAVTFNKYDDDHKKVMDGVFKKLRFGDLVYQGKEGWEDGAKKLVGLAHRFNYLPPPEAAAIRGLIGSPDPEKRQRGLHVAAMIIDRMPNAFERVEGGKDMAKVASQYLGLIRSGAFTPMQAIERMAQVKDPKFAKTLELWAAEAKTKAKDVTPDNVHDFFVELPDKGRVGFNSWFPRISTPGPSPAFGGVPTSTTEQGQTPAGSAALTGFVREIYRRNYAELGNDAAARKATRAELAAMHFGVTRFAGGAPVIMRHPPESKYETFFKIPGAREKLQKDLTDAVFEATGRKVPIEDIHLFTTPETERSMVAGHPVSGKHPRYAVMVKGTSRLGMQGLIPLMKDGKQAYWYVDVKRLGTEMAAEREKMVTREREIEKERATLLHRTPEDIIDRESVLPPGLSPPEPKPPKRAPRRSTEPVDTTIR